MIEGHFCLMLRRASHEETALDKQVDDCLLDFAPPTSRELTFLLEEGLELVANFAKINDAGLRRTVASLVAALAQTNIFT